MKRILIITLLILLLSACTPASFVVVKKTTEVGIVKSYEFTYIGVNGKIYRNIMWLNPAIAIGDTVGYTLTEYKNGEAVFKLMSVNGQEIVK